MLLSSTAIAGNPTRQFVFEQEEKAKRLGQIWNGDEIRRAVFLYSESAENWLKLNEPERASHCLREIGRLTLIIHDYKKGALALNQALKIDRKYKNFEGQVFSLSLLSQIEEQRNNIKKSKNLIEKALKLSAASTDYAKTLVNLTAGEFLLIHAEVKDSITHIKRAEKFANKIDNRNLKAKILLNCGILHSIKSDYTKAFEKLRKAKKIWEQNDNKRGLALTYSTLGFVHVISNEKQKAFEYYKKAEQMFPENVDLPEKAKIYGGLAKINYDYGQIDLAEINFRKALTLQEKIDYKFGQLVLLPDFARLLNSKGYKQESQKLLNRSIKLAVKLENNFVIANTTEHLGLIDMENGFYNEAISKFLKAGEVFSKLGVELPRIQNSLGIAYEKKGNIKLARSYFLTALRQNRKNKDVIEMGKNLYNLARLSKSGGNIENAIKEAFESISVTESVYGDVGNSQLRRSFLSDVFDRYELYINLLMQMHKRFPKKGFELKALQASEKSRSRLLIEKIKLSEADFTGDADPILVKREKAALELLNSKSNKLTELLRNGAKKNKIKKITYKLKEIENVLENIKAELRRKSPIYSAIKNPVEFNLNRFQKNVLDEETVLLEFSFGKEESYLWVVSKNEINTFVLPGREELEKDLTELRKLIAFQENFDLKDFGQYHSKVFEAEFKFQRKAKKLSKILFGQAIEQISGKRLLIVPDGKLKFFPISALPFPDNASNLAIIKPFLLTNEIIYEPSASTLELLKKIPEKSKPAAKNLLIFSDPIVSPNDQRIVLPERNERNETSIQNLPKSSSEDFLKPTATIDSFQRLYASEKESDSILAKFGLKNSTLVSGFEANRKNFINYNFDDYKIIHFATHGFLDENRPELSGIVLSLYDIEGNNSDGIIRLQDIYSLNLSANLVVLSACDTGIGKDIKGEGLMSLTNAFMQIGAKSVISSRWKVDDYATHELMNDFYQILADENITPSQALRKAKINMMNDTRFKSPYYWAAFTIQGDFEQITEVSKKFNYSKYLYLLAIILGLFGMLIGYRVIRQQMNK